VKRPARKKAEPQVELVSEPGTESQGMAEQAEETPIQGVVEQAEETQSQGVPEQGEETLAAPLEAADDAGTSISTRSDNSCLEPTHVGASDDAHSQTGRGVPQERLRPKAQSMLFSSQLPKRPFLICSGTQLISWFSWTMRSLIALVLMNQVGLAM